MLPSVNIPGMTSPETVQLMTQILDLKKQLVEAQRRIPPQPVGDYRFRRLDGSEVALTELFGDKDDLLLVHNMGRTCPYCTLWADGFEGLKRHLLERAGFALVTPDSPEVAGEFARQRGWTFPILSATGSTFAADMGFEPEAGHLWPGVSAFRRREDGSVVRTGSSVFGPGDDFCAVWPLFDLFENGANGWEPS